MTRASAIKQNEISKALKAGVAAGITVGCYEVDPITGTVRVYAEGQAPKGRGGPNPDELLGPFA